MRGRFYLKKRSKKPPNGKRAILFLLALTIVFVWLVIRNPNRDPLRHLRAIGYHCQEFNQIEQTNCFDPNQKKDDPKALVSLQLWTPYKPGASSVIRQEIMAPRCPPIYELAAEGFLSYAWEYPKSKKYLLAPTRDYYQAPLLDNLEQFQKKLESDLENVSIGRRISLETRCKYYDNYGLTPF